MPERHKNTDGGEMKKKQKVCVSMEIKFFKIHLENCVYLYPWQDKTIKCHSSVEI